MLDINKLDEQIQLQVSELEKLYSVAHDTLLEWLESEKTVSIITIRGYTPSYNDGEPCEHSSTCYVNLSEHSYEEIEVPEDVIQIQECPDSQTISLIEKYIHAFVEKEFGTNYLVQYVLRNGHFERTYQEYDAGY